MSAVRKENVLRIDADNDTAAGPLIIEHIRVVATANGASAQIRADQDSAGVILWESDTLASGHVDSQEVCIRAASGIHVDLVDCVVYLYLE
jgi:hypothetical protein